MPLRVSPSSLDEPFQQPDGRRSAERGALLLAIGLAAILVGLGLRSASVQSPGSPSSPTVLAGASATPVVETASATSAVRITRGEGGAGLVASWALPVGPVMGEGLRIDAVTDGFPSRTSGPSRTSAPSASLAGSVWSTAVRAGASAVFLPLLPPSGTYTVTVTVVGPGGAKQLGPSAPFQPSDGGGSESSGSSVNSAATGLPCEGATYGIGAVTVDGWAGYQGSYCIPPTFSGGTGAFCIDHGLDYPFGVASYGWRESLAGGSVALVNQYDQAAAPALVARLNWIIATWGSTNDPARATAIGVISHAVMGDYPGLTIGQLAPATFAVAGGNPEAIAADTAQMWSGSAAASAPYLLTVNLSGGPYDIGQAATGTIKLSGQGGAPVVGIPIDFSRSAGVSVIGDQPVGTGADGTVGFRFTPLATSFRIAASTPVSLPGPQVESWTPTGAGVATQRVITSGPAVAAGGALSLSARALGQATLVKVSADASSVAVGSGFRFAVERREAAGRWAPIAVRSTLANGTMPAITGLVSGEYQVVEQATPTAFVAGGPWRFVLNAGERATWRITDQARPVSLQVVKTGDDPLLPVAAGVRFAVTPDPVRRDPQRATAAPLGTLTTTTAGTTSQLSVPPGRYLLSEVAPPPGYFAAKPLVVDVPPAQRTSPPAITVGIRDRAIPGTLVLRKTDARTGALVAGAKWRISADWGPSGHRVLGTWKSGAVPTKVGSLLPGPYTVTEVRPPPGYLLSPDPSQRVTLQAGETLQLTFADSTVAAPTTTKALPVTTSTARVAPTIPGTALPATTASTASAVPVTGAAASPATLPVATPATAPVAAAANTGALAFTGSSSLRLVGWALVALGAGIGLVGLARRRLPSG